MGLRKAKRKNWITSGKENLDGQKEAQSSKIMPRNINGRSREGRVNALMVRKQQALPGETRVPCLPYDNGLIIYFPLPCAEPWV